MTLGDPASLARRAKDAFTKALADITDDAPNPVAYRSETGLAQLALEGGNIEDAAKHLDAALALNKKYFAARALQAKVVLKNGEGDRAVRFIDALDKDTNGATKTNTDVQLVYAEALATQKGAKPEDKDKAKAILVAIKGQGEAAGGGRPHRADDRSGAARRARRARAGRSAAARDATRQDAAEEDHAAETSLSVGVSVSVSVGVSDLEHACARSLTPTLTLTLTCNRSAKPVSGPACGAPCCLILAGCAPKWDRSRANLAAPPRRPRSRRRPRITRAPSSTSACAATPPTRSAASSRPTIATRRSAPSPTRSRAGRSSSTSAATCAATAAMTPARSAKSRADVRGREQLRVVGARVHDRRDPHVVGDRGVRARGVRRRRRRARAHRHARRRLPRHRARQPIDPSRGRRGRRQLQAAVARDRGRRPVVRTLCGGDIAPRDTLEPHETLAIQPGLVVAPGHHEITAVHLAPWGRACSRSREVAIDVDLPMPLPVQAAAGI